MMPSRPVLRLNTNLSGETIAAQANSSSSWTSGCSSTLTLDPHHDARLLVECILQGRILAKYDLAYLGVSWPIQAWVRDEAVSLLFKQPYDVWYGQRDALLLLLQSGEDVTGVDPLGDTALHILAGIPGKESAAFMSLLLGQEDIAFSEEIRAHYRASINGQNFYNNTALVVAALYNQCHCISVLLGLGADPGIKGEFDKTALEFAQERSSREVAKLLLQHDT